MTKSLGQGTIGRRTATVCTSKGQGATEYLVLLAVVLIIALVSIALLGFFPGTASDTSLTESQIYWKSVFPLSIPEAPVPFFVYDPGVPEHSNLTFMYLKLRNTGSYPLTITQLLGAGSSLAVNIPVAPGEETCLGTSITGTTVSLNQQCSLNPVSWSRIGYIPGGSLPAINSPCNPDGTGTIKVDNFGFTYYQTINNVQITKTFLGQKSLLMKCQGICSWNGSLWTCR